MLIGCTWSLCIYEKLYIDFVEDTAFSRMSSLLLTFSLLLLSPIIINQSVLWYFSSGEVDYRTWIRVLPGCYIIFQSHLILMQYDHLLLMQYDNIFSPHSWIGMTVLFNHNFICCILEDNVTRLLFNKFFPEGNHNIIGPGFLYLNRCNCVAWYLIDIFRLGSRIYFNVGRTFLSICG